MLIISEVQCLVRLHFQRLPHLDSNKIEELDLLCVWSDLKISVGYVWVRSRLLTVSLNVHHTTVRDSVYLVSVLSVLWRERVVMLIRRSNVIRVNIKGGNACHFLCHSKKNT